jgi:hypothetical protein
LGVIKLAMLKALTNMHVNAMRLNIVCLPRATSRPRTFHKTNTPLNNNVQTMCQRAQLTPFTKQNDNVAHRQKQRSRLPALFDFG